VKGTVSQHVNSLFISGHFDTKILLSSPLFLDNPTIYVAHLQTLIKKQAPSSIPLLTPIDFWNLPFSQAIRSLSFLPRHSLHSSQFHVCLMNDTQDEKRQCLGQKSAWNIRVTEQHFNVSVCQTKHFAPDRHLGHSTHTHCTLIHTPQLTLFHNTYVIHPLLQILNQLIEDSASQVSNRWPILSFLPLMRSGMYC
jgi:hypothetical protein